MVESALGDSADNKHRTFPALLPRGSCHKLPQCTQHMRIHALQVVTCNYPARAAGVTKLMAITEARARCPQLALVPGEDLSPYRWAWAWHQQPAVCKPE